MEQFFSCKIGFIALLLLSIIISAVVFRNTLQNSFIEGAVQLQNYPLLYIFGYAIGALCLPAPLLSVIAGFLYKNSVTTVFVIMLGSLLGAVLSFYISRIVLQGYVRERFLTQNPTLQKIDLCLKKDSLMILICARILSPYTLINYFLGITSAGIQNFLLATSLTGFPYAIMYMIIGSQINNMQQLMDSSTFEIQGDDITIPIIDIIAPKYVLQIFAIGSGISLFLWAANSIRKFASQTLDEALRQNTEKFPSQALDEAISQSSK